MHKTETLNSLSPDDITENKARVSFISGIVTWSRWRDEHANGMFYVADADNLETAKNAAAFVLFSRVKDGFPQRGEKVVCVCRVDCDTKSKPNVTRNYPLAIFGKDDDDTIAEALKQFAKGISPKVSS